MGVSLPFRAAETRRHGSRGFTPGFNIVGLQPLGSGGKEANEAGLGLGGEKRKAETRPQKNAKRRF